MGRIFISYSHKDKDYVHKLQEALQKEGFEVWIDDRINYGTEWPKVIQRHLDECDAFFEAVRQNRLIYCAEDFDASAFFSLVLRQYFDFAPYLKTRQHTNGECSLNFRGSHEWNNCFTRFR